jgi:hypothetical protein
MKDNSKDMNQYSDEELEKILRNNPKSSKEYKSAYQKIWYKENKLKKKEQAAKRYQENTEEYLARNKIWSDNNKEYVKEIKKEYRIKNAETIKVKNKIKYEKTKDDPEKKRKGEEYREKTKEQSKKRGKEYRKNNKDKIKIKDQRWYNERGGKKKTKKNYIKNKDRYQRLEKERRKRYIDKLYDILGNKCAFCKKTDPILFTIDHIHNDGKEERKILHGSNGLAIHLNRLGWPEEYIKERYQILCYNCNYSKNRREYLNKLESDMTKKELKEFHLWQDAYKFFGRCEICKETSLKYLTVDHRNNNGNLRRKIEKEPGGAQLLRRFELMGWPESLRLEYRLLCYNCNCGRQRLRPILAMPASKLIMQLSEQLLPQWWS